MRHTTFLLNICNFSRRWMTIVLKSIQKNNGIALECGHWKYDEIELLVLNFKGSNRLGIQSIPSTKVSDISFFFSLSLKCIFSRAWEKKKWYTDNNGYHIIVIVLCHKTDNLTKFRKLYYMWETFHCRIIHLCKMQSLK